MANATVWKNVAINMQSAAGSAVTITGLTKASPGVATATSHGFSNGDVVLLTANGMWQVNDKVVRVANVTTNTFELEGVDTTSFETFTSGSAQEITFGTSITTATTINASGGDFAFIDTTTIHGNAQTQVPGLPSAISYSMDNIWDASDAGQVAMKSASDSQAKRCFKFQFGTGGKVIYFAGYVGFSGLPGGQAQNLVTTQAAFTINGSPTYYAS